jgi:hypothetical protein
MTDARENTAEGLEWQAFWRRLDAAEAENERLRAALKECAEDLEAMIEGYYSCTKDHPAMERRYERDMEPVRKARDLLLK